MISVASADDDLTTESLSTIAAASQHDSNAARQVRKRRTSVERDEYRTSGTDGERRYSIVQRSNAARSDIDPNEFAARKELGRRRRAPGRMGTTQAGARDYDRRSNSTNSAQGEHTRPIMHYIY